MLVERQLHAIRVARGAVTEDVHAGRVEQALADELSRPPARLKRRVQGQPGLRPHQAVGDLLLYLRKDRRVLDVQESIDEVLVVVEHVPQYAERVHNTPSSLVSR